MSQQPAPEATVTWDVVFRCGEGPWHPWERARASSADAIRAAEPLASMPGVTEIRFERVTTNRERLSLHDIAQAEE
ncbi:hypothetical protein ACIPJK_07480 [Streptomyces roseus]|uniref:hypothetical protein n=1 Tax=Streptomyces roseus TaxID=66430 RepID=UPI00382B17B4